MPQEKPVLFKIFPSLVEKINYINLETKPSPVHRLKNFDHKNLWIKRNDSISFVCGGNKVRRLEFILGEVIKEKKSRVVTEKRAVPISLGQGLIPSPLGMSGSKSKTGPQPPPGYGI
jgi:hypothetical protein